MKKIVLIFFFLFSSNKINAFLFLEPYLGPSLQFGEFDEKMSETRSLDHSNTIYGIEVGARGGISLLGILLGVTGAERYSHWDGRRADGKDFLIFNTKGYDNTVRMRRWGPMIGFRVPKKILRFWGEYYPEVKNDFTYSDTEEANMFFDGDRLKGTGFGIGIGSQIELFSFSIIYQQFTYDILIRQNNHIPLPSDTMTKVKERGVLFNTGIFLDIF